jgi:hypothetical protein
MQAVSTTLCGFPLAGNTRMTGMCLLTLSAVMWTTSRTACRPPEVDRRPWYWPPSRFESGNVHEGRHQLAMEAAEFWQLCHEGCGGLISAARDALEPLEAAGQSSSDSTNRRMAFSIRESAY